MVRGMEVPTDDLDELVGEVESDSHALAAYEDSSRRVHIVKELAAARARRLLTQESIAETIGTTQSAISELENNRTDPRLSTLQRYARACGYGIRIALAGVDGEIWRATQPTSPAGSQVAEGVVKPDPHEDDLDKLSSEVDSDEVSRISYADAKRRSDLLRKLVAARGQLNLNQKRIARALGTTQSAISELESGRTDARLSTLQRYARACDLILDISVVSNNAIPGIGGLIAPTVDKATADPVLLESVDLAAAIGIEDVLRTLLKGNSLSGMSWSSLSSATRLSQSAKIRTMHGLVSQGWLNYFGGLPGPAARLTVNRSAATFIGISVRADHVRGIATGLNPSPDFSDLHRVPLSDASPDSVIRAITGIVDHFRSSSAPNPLGIGVELAGPINASTGTVLFAPDLQPYTDAVWENYPLEAAIQTDLGVRTVVMNDAAALAIRELISTGAPDGLILVYLSESSRGIGAGLVFNGALVSGVDGEGGEIGHITVNPDGEECLRCRRGRRGCLETVASGRAIADALGVTDLAEASAMVSHHRRSASYAFKEAGAVLGHVLGDLATVLNPGRIVIYGPRELVSDQELASARYFSTALNMEMSDRSLLKKGEPILIVPQDSTAPLAAASAAVNDFLRRPLEYAPEMTSQSPLVPTVPMTTSQERQTIAHRQFSL